MILAAGRGERMRPLTDATPKPLLQAGNKRLIEHTITALADANIKNIVINHAWLGEQIEATLGQGERYDVRLTYSAEGEALETAGGIIKALPLLGPEPFIVVNGDIYTDYPFEQLLDCNPLPGHAHLVMIPNPAHHSAGDFYLTKGLLSDVEPGNHDNGTLIEKVTFAGISVYHPSFFNGFKPGKRALAPLLREAMSRACVTGELYHGQWFDIGTPERLAELDKILAAA